MLSLAARARAAAEARLKAAEGIIEAAREQPMRSLWSSGIPRIRMAEICSIEARQVDPKEGDFANLPHVSGENIESGTGGLFGVRTAAEDGMVSGKYLFEEGDVLYSKLRPYLRKVTVAGFRGVCSADMYPLRPRSSRVEAGFLAETLLSREFTKYAVAESGRARMPKLNREQLMKWESPLPGLDQQREIVSKLRSVAEAASRLRMAADGEASAVSSLPAALLRRAFLGEL